MIFLKILENFNEKLNIIYKLFCIYYMLCFVFQNCLIYFQFFYLQNIFESIKDEKVKQDLLTGNNGAVQLTDEELTKLSNFSKMVLPKRRVEEGKPLFEVIILTET